MSYINAHEEQLSWIPAALKPLIQEGIFAAWKIRKPRFIFEKQWNGATILDDAYSIYVLENLFFIDSITDQHKNPTLVDFVIIDKNGNILAKNFDASVILDENGFIHIDYAQKSNHLPYLVKSIPHKTYDDYNFFFAGESLKAINNAVKYAIENSWIKRPKDFDAKHRTFKNLPVSNPSEKI